MSNYIPFTDDQKLRAGEVDLEEFLLRHGEKLIVSGSEKRMASDHSVTVRGNEWYDHATGEGGGPVSFVENYPTVVSYFARRGLLYKDTGHHNCVFVGWDEDGISRHAHVRSTNSFAKPFRINIEGGDPRYSFHHVGTDNRLYVFEAPIDMLSFITLYPRDWREHSYVACCGTSIQPVIQTGAQMDCRKAAVFLCLDNDRAGNMASERMAETFGRAGLETVRIPPRRKDWNEDLVAQRQAQEVRQWPAMCGP